jgi:hypothetical protein
MVSLKFMTSELQPQDIQTLYQSFDTPIASLDCGSKCAPYNERGVPYCCDTKHTVPAAYLSEWTYYQDNTDLWHIWPGADEFSNSQLNAELPENMILLECSGHKFCQRNFRSIACRSFPFFPYLDRQNEFIGLAYYWEYEDRCWVMSNLEVVSDTYRQQFIQVYTGLFKSIPAEFKNYVFWSAHMREIFVRQNRGIPLLHRDGNVYNVSPQDGKLNLCQAEDFPKYGPYEIAATLRFPDEE